MNTRTIEGKPVSVKQIEVQAPLGKAIIFGVYVDDVLMATCPTEDGVEAAVQSVFANLGHKNQ